jgi:hypothetical protein
MVEHKGMSVGGQEFLSNERIGRLGAVLYLASAAVTLASPLLPAPPAMQRTGVLLVGAVGLVMGVSFLFLPWGRMPRSASLWIAAVPAQALIGVHNYLGGSDPYRYGLFFMVCYAWMGLAQPRWSTLKLLPFTGFAYLVPLALRPSPAGAPGSSIYALPIFVLAG